MTAIFTVPCWLVRYFTPVIFTSCNSSPSVSINHFLNAFLVLNSPEFQLGLFWYRWENLAVFSFLLSYFCGHISSKSLYFLPRFVVSSHTWGEHEDSSPKGCWGAGCIPPAIKIRGKHYTRIVPNGQKCVQVLYFISFLITHCYEYVKTPNTRHQVEHAQLARLVELGVLALGEVEAPDDFLRHNNRLCERSHNGWELNSATVRHEGVSQVQKHSIQHTQRHRILFLTVTINLGRRVWKMTVLLK